MTDSSLVNDMFSLIGFVVSIIFFIWFGSTLSSINRHLANIADHSERQTKMLASVANAAPGPRVTVVADDPLD
jgi:hypothetical protein